MKKLLEFGAEVWLLDTDVITGKQAVQKLGSKIHFYQLDVIDPAANEVCAEMVVKESSGIDVLVNCAGIARITSALEAEDDEWRLIKDVNLNGTFGAVECLDACIS